jgi:hypothetical protein
LVKRSENVPEYPTAADEIEPVHRDSKALTKRDGDNEDVEKRKPLPPSIPIDLSSTDAVKCFLDTGKKTRIPALRAYEGVMRGMPESVMGSYEVLGLRNDVCFERFGRLGPYGLGYSKSRGGSGAGMEGDREGIEQVWEDTEPVNFDNVHWKDAQEDCFAANKHRFAPIASHDEKVADSNSTRNEENDDFKGPEKRAVLLKRTAIIIRTWAGYQYDHEDLFYLRSLIWELAMQTGGQYTVHFLVHVRNNKLPIWADEATYQRVLNESLPLELQGMGTLWSEAQMEMVYGNLERTSFRNLPVHGVYRGLMMPLMWFAHEHPEFDQFWNFEMDMRYTGHFQHLLEQVSKWAAKQPRKHLWERNARFYIPSEHGSWEDFTATVRTQTEHGTASKSNIWSNVLNNPAVPDVVKEEFVQKAEKPVWGPEAPPFNDLDTSDDILPPRPMKQDRHEWGVGEEADLITFNPLFDPHGTTWLLADDVTGYNKTAGLPPRRAAIVNFSRLSRRLLMRMHGDTALYGRSMFSEMFPASVALHHGLKAVYAPHPVFVDRRWPTDFLAATFNGGRNGQSGGNRMGVFGDREHNFLGTTWYYNAGFAPNLWKRWLGYRVDNDGGEAQELAGEGRICLPPMLFHPVKHVDLVYQSILADAPKG